MPPRDLHPGELAAYLASEAGQQALLLDVREPWEFAICQLPGSTLAPMRGVPGLLNQLDPARPTVVICHHGIRSRQVANFLARQGFSQVINLRGGVDAWAREQDPQMATY